MTRYTVEPEPARQLRTTADGWLAIGRPSHLRVAKHLADPKQNSAGKVYRCDADGCSRPADHQLQSTCGETLGSFCQWHGCAALRSAS